MRDGGATFQKAAGVVPAALSQATNHMVEGAGLVTLLDNKMAEKLVLAVKLMMRCT